MAIEIVDLPIKKNGDVWKFFVGLREGNPPPPPSKIGGRGASIEMLQDAILAGCQWHPGVSWPRCRV